MKKKLIVILGFLISASVVTALWLLGPAISGFATYRVTSDEVNITILANLLGGDFDTTNAPINFTDRIEIDSNIEQSYLVSMEILRIDDETDSCTDYINDCSVEVFYDTVGYGYDEQILDGYEVELIEGLNYLNVKGSCKQYSCPQNISLNMTLIPAEN